MGIWNILGWAMAIVMILAFWAFVIYMCSVGVSFMWPKIPGYINGKVKGICSQCGMAKRLGHWPGCDFWKGENLDLMVFGHRGELPHICGSTVNHTDKPCPNCGAMGSL